ncbi:MULTISPECIES: DUF4236 domain-containing protein [Acetobacter]|jgi:hypothetical protein|uniref:DUF4236 domain-containing protein n=2 Tax=Acetobacter TaxID=434 RepID=A0A841QGQ7_9PROT|nr:DUF4236 domain-containing protein [Acetobacter lovaniensis]MBB6457598.1 hypothetical protein [Acetobacter lovaniensis]MCI1698265.1 DUF4236 domain-containing protein [Acetobacter lovaniensis]MCP1240040.1 DUF4236 domain-containing protein [Acetobacter lovaniensis]NHN81885.1 DUF4236 domain-containing protein [Acetobacter lovaniensis]GBQ64738.1 membrane-anchored nucleotide-binding enzyme [Acetobacter lovaniensis NRIC 0474]
MPIYLKKSVKAGPFRFNFSKGGIGVSVGVRGLRIGTGPKGHYVHAGRGGIYYRASIGRAGEKHVKRVCKDVEPPKTEFVAVENVQMIEVESGDVLEMRNEAYQDILDDMNTKRKQMHFAPMFFWWTLAVSIVGAFTVDVGFVFLFMLSPLLWGIGRWLDSYRRTTVLFYDLEGSVQSSFGDMTAAFDSLIAARGKWHIEAGGAVTDITTWKRNAGASYIIRKKPTKLKYALPREVKSNIIPPALHVGKQIIYFLPDVALVDDGIKIGAVGYSDLQLRSQDSRFIEEGKIPSDAKVVGHTWKHPNKSGGPDRRFKVNPRIPICLYEALQLRSESGLNELVEFSKSGVATSFINSIQPLRLPTIDAPAMSGIVEMTE